MGSIANLFFAALLDDKRLQLDAQRAGDKASDSLGSRITSGIRRSLSGTGGDFAKFGVASGAAGAVATKAMNVVGNAVQRVTEFIGDSVAAYRESQISVGKLDAALKANVQGWDGNTDAIERTLKAREELAFSDEETRDSLSLLVGATGDVRKALDIQSTAMDLARFKSISLAEASEALTKVEAGSYRILKSLGIVLRDGATQTEALAAVQKVAGGQAQKYAESDLAKVDIAQIKVNNSMEKIGKTFSEVASAVLPAVADAFEKIVDVADGVGEGIRKLGDENVSLDDKIRLVNDALFAGLPFYETTEQALRRVRTQGGLFADTADYMADRVKDDMAIVGDAAVDMRDVVKEAMKASAAAVEENEKRTTAALKGVIDNAYNPLIAAAQIAATQRDIAEQDQIISSEESTAEQIADARLRRLELQKSLADQLIDLGTYGTAAQRISFLNGQLQNQELIDGLASKDPEVRAQAQATVKAIEDELRGLQTRANGYGFATGSRWGRSVADGMNDAFDEVTGAFKQYEGVFRASSPPGPDSPLHHIGDWAERTGEEYDKRFARGILAGAAARALRSLANPFASLTPAFASPLAGIAAPDIRSPGLGRAIAVADEHAAAGLANASFSPVLTINVDARGAADPGAIGDAVVDRVTNALEVQQTRFTRRLRVGG